MCLSTNLYCHLSQVKSPSIHPQTACSRRLDRCTITQSITQTAGAVCRTITCARVRLWKEKCCYIPGSTIPGLQSTNCQVARQEELLPSEGTARAGMKATLTQKASLPWHLPSKNKWDDQEEGEWAASYQRSQLASPAQDT